MVLIQKLSFDFAYPCILLVNIFINNHIIICVAGVLFSRLVITNLSSLSLSFLFVGKWRASADNARLYFEDDHDNLRIGAWCATDRDNQWLKIDLGQVKKVRAIGTQGMKTN